MDIDAETLGVQRTTEQNVPPVAPARGVGEVAMEETTISAVDHKSKFESLMRIYQREHKKFADQVRYKCSGSRLMTDNLTVTG